jgi:hypothetical protein
LSRATRCGQLPVLLNAGGSPRILRQVATSLLAPQAAAAGSVRRVLEQPVRGSQRSAVHASPSSQAASPLQRVGAVVVVVLVAVVEVDVVVVGGAVVVVVSVVVEIVCVVVVVDIGSVGVVG